MMMRNWHLTLCVPEKVEDTRFQKSLWVLVDSYVKLSVIDQIYLSPLKSPNQKYVKPS